MRKVYLSGYEFQRVKQQRLKSFVTVLLLK
jgi:hypothetical protein